MDYQLKRSSSGTFSTVFLAFGCLMQVGTFYYLKSKMLQYVGVPLPPGTLPEAVETIIVRCDMIMYFNIAQTLLVLLTCMIPFQMFYWLVATGGMVAAATVALNPMLELILRIALIVLALSSVVTYIMPMHLKPMSKKRPFSFVPIQKDAV